jgi:hypothetical protein
MPSSFLQIPLWLQAEKDLLHQLASNEQADMKDTRDESASFINTSASGSENNLSSQGVKAAHSLGLVRHFF